MDNSDRNVVRLSNWIRRWIARLVVALLATTVALELVARYGLGLGDPPLSKSDPQIEYLFQPSKSYLRLGNHVSFNSWSMRSDELSAKKSNPDELRILVLGDSVVNGGSQTDQAELATEIIKRELSAPGKLNRPVAVGNISAGSWGPANLLAYVRRYGLFDADIVVLVLSSHDAADAPTFAPLSADVPEQAPILALQEAAQRYLPRYLPDWLGGREPESPRSASELQEDRNESLAALRELIGIIKESGAQFVIMQHAERVELNGKMQTGHADIEQLAADLTIPTVQLAPGFAKSIASGIEPYRDEIHPNAAGQRVLADAMMEWIVAQHSR